MVRGEKYPNFTRLGPGGVRFNFTLILLKIKGTVQIDTKGEVREQNYHYKIRALFKTDHDSQNNRGKLRPIAKMQNRAISGMATRTKKKNQCGNWSLLRKLSQAERDLANAGTGGTALHNPVQREG